MVRSQAKTGIPAKPGPLTRPRGLFNECYCLDPCRGRDDAKTKEPVVVMKLSSTAAGLIAGFSLLTVNTLFPKLAAAQNIYCNSYGGCTGTTRSGASVNTYTNPYGGTTGTIGGQSVNTYTNPYGGTSGSIGGQSVNLYTNPYGGTSGSIGGQSVNCYTSYGVTRCN